MEEENQIEELVLEMLKKRESLTTKNKHWFHQTAFLTSLQEFLPNLKSLNEMDLKLLSFHAFEV